MRQIDCVDIKGCFHKFNLALWGQHSLCGSLWTEMLLYGCMMVEEVGVIAASYQGNSQRSKFCTSVSKGPEKNVHNYSEFAKVLIKWKQTSTKQKIHFVSLFHYILYKICWSLWLLQDYGDQTIHVMFGMVSRAPPWRNFGYLPQRCKNLSRTKWFTAGIGD